MNVKEAVKTALEYFQKLYSNTTTYDVLLEEVELSEDGSIWNITLGFTRELQLPPHPMQNIALALSPKTVREYKIVEIFNKSGEVRSMKIRTP